MNGVCSVIAEYFNIDPTLIRLAWILFTILLDGSPNALGVYVPTKNPETAKKRYGQIINKMIEYKYITEEQAKEILMQSNS